VLLRTRPCESAAATASVRGVFIWYLPVIEKAVCGEALK